MKTFCLTAMIVLLLSCSFGALNAQNVKNKVCLDNTEQFSITSKHVAGENYIIQVGLPIGYSNSQKSYPVLYVLDGDKSFGMTKEIADWLMWSKEIKDIIVIGISYGQGMDAWWNKRARDYTMSKDTIFGSDFQNAGGADNFIKFVQYELFPEVNKKYRTIPDSSAICGLSFGGLLSSYILFTQPEMFKGYIIIAPALVWNDKCILKLENEYFSNYKELNKTIYIAYGSLDNKDWIINPTDEFIQIVKLPNYQGLHFVPKIFEGDTHISVFSTAFTNGLKILFKPSLYAPRLSILGYFDYYIMLI
jgi:predicted alpha/beta superfamily hydrolase